MQIDLQRSAAADIACMDSQHHIYLSSCTKWGEKRLKEAFLHNVCRPHNAWQQLMQESCCYIIQDTPRQCLFFFLSAPLIHLNTSESGSTYLIQGTKEQ